MEEFARVIGERRGEQHAAVLELVQDRGADWLWVRIAPTIDAIELALNNEKGA